MSVGLLPQFCGFITLSASVIFLSFAKIGQWLWEVLINLISSIPQWREKRKNDPESLSRTGSPPKVNQFFRLVGPVITPISTKSYYCFSAPNVLTIFRHPRRRGMKKPRTISRCISETISIGPVTVERILKLVCGLSNGAISSDLEWPLTQVVSKACHYS